MRLSARRLEEKKLKAYEIGFENGRKCAEEVMDIVCKYFAQRKKGITSGKIFNAFTHDQAVMEGLRYLTYHYDEWDSEERAIIFRDQFYRDRMLSHEQIMERDRAVFKKYLQEKGGNDNDSLMECYDRALSEGQKAAA